MIFEPTLTFVGIDPGQTGGISILLPNSQLSVLRFDGEDPLEVLDGISVALSFCPSVVLESVHAMPGQGVTSMFTFGVGFGRLQGWLTAKGVKFELYAPQTWQGFLPYADTPKAKVRLYCERRWGLDKFIFPGCRVPHQGCMDAACMAEFKRLVTIGEIEPPKVRKPSKRRQAIRI